MTDVADVRIVLSDRLSQPSQIVINGTDIADSVTAATVVLEPGRPAEIHLATHSPGVVEGQGVVYVHSEEPSPQAAESAVRTFLAGIDWESVIPEVMSELSLGDDPADQLRAYLFRQLEDTSWT